MTTPEYSIAQLTNKTASEKNIPLSVQIELTYQCNCSCYYCYQQNFDKSARDLPFEFWADVLDQLSAAGSLYLTVTGGEPLVHNDFMRMVTHARKRSFAVSIISNGTRITPATARQLASLSIMDIGISFHSARSHAHDALSGMPGSFDLALAALRECKAAGIKVLVKHSVSSRNFGEYLALESMAKAEGAAFECDSLVTPDAAGGQSQWALSGRQQAQFLEHMAAGTFPATPDALYAQLHCDAGRSICGITPKGVVVPCIQLPLALGNLVETPFKAIWNGAAVANFRGQESRLSSECTSCASNARCSRCHGIAFLETGEWRGKSPSLCERAGAGSR
jgi:MoaA/NifB/PqqE/SkfB family radical SAM enzyme